MCSLMFTPGSRGGTGDMAESRVTPMLWIRSVSIMNTGGSRIAMSAWNKTKYFRLRLSYEISQEKANRDLWKAWEWPKIDLRRTWTRKMKIQSSIQTMTMTDKETEISTPWAPDGAKEMREINFWKDATSFVLQFSFFAFTDVSFIRVSFRKQIVSCSLKN